jgi:PAS domain S-box-containing protein
MPFRSIIANQRIVERIERIRQHPDDAYGVAIGLVALAAFARLALGDYVGTQLPFITFFPAIIIAALLGGLWPGVCATILSALAAWYLFLPPAYSWGLEHRELVQLLLFLFFCAVNLAVVTIVNALMDGVLAREEDMRRLLDCVPAAIVVVDEHGQIKLVNAGTEKLFGYKRLELLERNIEILVPARLAEMHKSERERFLQKPEERPMGVGRDPRGRRKNGSEFAVEIVLNPITRNGRSAVLATIIDISERKRAQQSQDRPGS